MLSRIKTTPYTLYESPSNKSFVGIGCQVVTKNILLGILLCNNIEYSTGIYYAIKNNKIYSYIEKMMETDSTLATA